MQNTMSKKATIEIPQDGVVNIDVENVNVSLITRNEHINGEPLNCVAVYNKEKNAMQVVQKIHHSSTKPQLRRTDMCIYRAMNRGRVKATFTFDPTQKGIKEQLITDIREALPIVTEKRALYDSECNRIEKTKKH